MQLVRYIKQGVAAGVIKNGDEMPSRRVLSALLGINPNTVQKAYRILEDEGVIQSHAGAKSSVSIDAGQKADIRAQLTESSAKAVIDAMKNMGISKKQALSLVEKLWD